MPGAWNGRIAGSETIWKPGVPGPCVGGLSKIRSVASEATANALMLVPPVNIRAEVNATAAARTISGRKRFATPPPPLLTFR
jgi:hypothetical protein